VFGTEEMAEDARVVLQPAKSKFLLEVMKLSESPSSKAWVVRDTLRVAAAFAEMRRLVAGYARPWTMALEMELGQRLVNFWLSARTDEKRVRAWAAQINVIVHEGEVRSLDALIV